MPLDRPRVVRQAEVSNGVADAEVGGGEGIAIAEAHADVGHGPRPDAAERPERVRLDRHAVGHRPREPDQGLRPRTGHRKGCAWNSGQRFGGRKAPFDVAGGSGQQFAVRGRQPAGDGAGRGDAHLLADHGSHRDLERVGGARHADPGPRCNQWRERGIAAQVLVDGGRVGAGVGHSRHDGIGRTAVALVA